MNPPMDCCGNADPRDLSVEQARERIAAGLPSPTGIEQLPLRSALGRVLAEDLISPLGPLVGVFRKTSEIQSKAFRLRRFCRTAFGESSDFATIPVSGRRCAEP